MQILTKIKEWLFGTNVDICEGCKHEVDFQTCSCGERMQGHWNAEHAFVPMGCHCHYANEAQQELPFENNLVLTPELDEIITESQDGSVRFIESVNLPCESQEDFYTNLMARLYSKGYQIRRFTPYHFRINDRLDIFPVNRRWHDIKENRRGGYDDVFKFVSKFFNRF